jgi:hypothetical protein
MVCDRPLSVLARREPAGRPHTTSAQSLSLVAREPPLELLREDDVRHLVQEELHRGAEPRLGRESENPVRDDRRHWLGRDVSHVFAR